MPKATAEATVTPEAQSEAQAEKERNRNYTDTLQIRFSVKAENPLNLDVANIADTVVESVRQYMNAIVPEHAALHVREGYDREGNAIPYALGFTLETEETFAKRARTAATIRVKDDDEAAWLRAFRIWRAANPDASSEEFMAAATNA